MASTQPILPTRQAAAAKLIRHCIAYGVPFGLRALDERTLVSMLGALPFGTEIADFGLPGTPIFTLPAEDHPRFPALLERLQQQILLHVGLHAPDRTFLHAGVVAWQGQAIVFPGFSCAGKTTLVAELVKLGAVFYSDEYALLDANGMVHPYARDLHLREPGRLQRKILPVMDLPGEAAVAPTSVAQVVITEFAEGAVWNPEPLTPGVAILEMLRHSIPAKRKPAEVMATLSAVMRTAQAWRSLRGEARATAELLLRALSSEASPA